MACVKVLLTFEHFLKLVVEGQAAGLHGLGYDVKLLCRNTAREFDGSVAARNAILQPIRALGIEVFELPQRRFGPESVPVMRAIRRRLEQWGPDVVSAHDNDEPRLLWTSRGWPLVYTVHDPAPHPGEANQHHPVLQAGRAAWRRSADHLVVHGPQLVADLPKWARNKPIHVIPHGISVADVPLPVASRPTVLLFGRMEPYKGVDVLAQAMKLVWVSVPDARLIVAGRGPAVRDVPVDRRVDLRNRYIGQHELPALFREASVTVLPYTQASQSGVGLLSIAQGVPIVVTSVGALPELAMDRDSVVSPRDPAALARSLIDALARGESYRSRVLAFARAKFDWSIVARAYGKLYEQVVAGKDVDGVV